MPLPRVSSGQPFTPSASAFNRTAAAVELVESMFGEIKPGGVAGLRSRDVVFAKNASGSDIPLGGVVHPSATLFTPSDNLKGFQNEYPISAGAPVAGTMGRFGIAIEPIAIGKIGRVVFTGVAVTQVEITDPNVTEVAEIVGEVDRLVTAAHGTARILARESGSGTVWALIQLGVGRETGIRWKPIDSELISGSDPERFKYTLQRLQCEDDGTCSIPTDSEQVYGFNDFEDPDDPWHGQSDAPNPSATLTVAGPVTGPVHAQFCGKFDPDDGTPIYRFDTPNPMATGCESALDSGGMTQSQVENIAEGS